MNKMLAKVQDVPEGKGIVILLADGHEIALFKVNGEIYALDNSCPHQGGPLGEGTMDGSIVSCPWHGWEFNVTTGECLNMPTEAARKIEITIIDDAIYLANP
jgi:nitrite reductase/ring-hydroxylating ferredoxin subunit